MTKGMFMGVLVALISTTTLVRAQLVDINIGSSTNAIEIFPDDCIKLLPTLVQNAQSILQMLKDNPQNTQALASTVLSGGDFLNLGINKCLSKITDPTMLNCASQAAALAVNLVLGTDCPQITADVVTQKYETLRQTCSLLPPLPVS